MRTKYTARSITEKHNKRLITTIFTVNILVSRSRTSIPDENHYNNDTTRQSRTSIDE